MLYILLFSKNNTTSQWWCNGKYVPFECCRLWAKVPVKTKDYIIGICFFSTKHAALGARVKTYLLSEETCLPAECCFREQYENL